MRYPKFELRLSDVEMAALKAYSEGRGESMATVVRERLRDILEGDVGEGVGESVGSPSERAGEAGKKPRKAPKGEYSAEVEKMAAKLEDVKKDKPVSRKWVCKCGVANFGVVCIRCGEGVVDG